MLKPSWKKMLSDLWMTKGRTTLMVIAIAVSLFGVGVILSAYGILTREISVNYLNTNPAAATIKVEHLNESLLSQVEEFPQIEAVEGRSTILTRVQTDSDEWMPLLLFVVEDFADMKLSTFYPDRGSWPPTENTLLVERTTPAVFEVDTGHTIALKMPSGNQLDIEVSGIVHDPSLAPAWQEQMGYAYVTLDTLNNLGESLEFDELRFIVSENELDKGFIEQKALEISQYVHDQGYHVEEILVPPPGKHPHQNQMVAILILFIFFSLLSLVLSAILVASMISSMMAQQIRQIGVMKAIGASTGQISRLYLIMIFLISTLAIIIAQPLSMLAGKALAGEVSTLLNFTLYSTTVPWWVYVVQIIAGMFIPLLIALKPILRGSRITVREAINDYGVSQENFGSSWIEKSLNVFSGLDRSLLLALRNSFRRRSRFILNLGLLAAGGAMFMAGLNVSSSWDKDLNQAFEYRNYDVAVILNELEPVDQLLEQVEGVEGVVEAEAWGFAETSVASEASVDIKHTYPDGRHGSFTLFGVPENSELVSFPMVSGNWIEPSDTNGVVLNHMAHALVPDVQVGDTISLSVHGEQNTWTVTGIMTEVGSPAAAYINNANFEQTVGKTDHARSLRIVTNHSDPVKQEETIRNIEKNLDDIGASIAIVITDSQLRTAVDEHMTILIYSLITLAVLMALVGILGLTSTISTSVIERTREFGVMKTIGGTPSKILRNVVSEGLFIGILSWFVAILISLPLSYLIGFKVGYLSFRNPLTLTMSPLAMLSWLLIIIIGAIIATYFPAWRASRQTIRETLNVV